MWDPSKYLIDHGSVNSTPLRGRYLKRSLKGKGHEADFVGADLYRGTKYLVEPSLEQCGLIVGSDATSVWWAYQRLPFREAILAGELPLVPQRPKLVVPTTNGHDQSVAPFANGDFDKLVDLAKQVNDPNVWLAAGAVAVPMLPAPQQSESVPSKADGSNGKSTLDDVAASHVIANMIGQMGREHFKSVASKIAGIAF